MFDFVFVSKYFVVVTKLYVFTKTLESLVGHALMNKLSQILTNRPPALRLSIKRHSFAILKIFDRNALLGKCTADIFSVIVDFYSFTLSITSDHTRPDLLHF